jgi:hypothetical protein
MSFNFVNGGAKSQGFAIILYGEAIETDLISFLETEIEFYSMDHYVEEIISNTFEAATAVTANGESQKVYLCTFPDTFLPKGNWEESPIIKVKCSGVLNKLGNAQLIGVIIPHGNKDEGRTRFSTVIQGKN